MDASSDKKSNKAKPGSYASFGGPEDTSCPTLAENKKILHIIESFVTDGNKKLSSFLRKKISMELSSINTCLFETIENNPGKTVTLGFQIEPGVQFGCISFELVLLHAVIDLLYGGKVSTSEPVIERIGRTGIKIASKVAEICLSVFQDALNEHLKTNMSLSNLTTSMYSVFNQKLDTCCNFTFKISLDGATGNLCMVIPESILAVITAESNDYNENVLDNDDQEYHFNDHLKNELIDSKVMIYAMLPDIALLVKDVVNLRAGDIIPIGDPTFVYIAHNQKKLFTAIAGQSNSRRIVEIIDTV